MKKTSAWFALAFVLAIPFAQPGAAQSPSNKPILGVWRAQMGQVPVFSLVITDEGGELQGAILFYLIRRGEPGEPPTATPGLPAPILHPVFDGRTLKFQVSHRGAHPPRTLNDPPVAFEMTLGKDGNAEVVNEGEFKGLIITHSDY